MGSDAFIKKDKLTEFCTELIAAEIKRRNLESFGEVFNPCEITQCDRRIVYRIKGQARETTAADKALPWLQQQTYKACKDKWLNFFSSSLKIKVIDKEVIRGDTNYNLYGVLDAILQLGDLPLVLMIQPVYAEDFQKITANGAFRKHVVEQMVKMWLAEIPHGLILYDNLATGAYLLFHVNTYQPLLETIRKKCTYLKDFKLSAKLPPRSYKVKAKECSFCEFEKKCWEVEKPINKEQKLYEK